MIEVDVELEQPVWSIVAVGSFNPAIFHPSWLEQNEVISTEERTKSVVEIVHNDIAKFSVAGQEWQVERARISITTSLSPHIRILDSMEKILSEILPHSPVTAFGINRFAYFYTPSIEKRTEFGRKLAPLEPWGVFGEDVGKGQGDFVGGVSRIVMRLKKKHEGFGGFIDAIVEPSNILDGHRGVFVGLNSHFESVGNAEWNARLVAKIMSDWFDETNNYSDTIIQHLAKSAQ